MTEQTSTDRTADGERTRWAAGNADERPEERGEPPQVFDLKDLPFEVLLDGALKRSALRSENAFVNIIWITPDIPYIPPHTHPEDQISFVLQGTAEFEIDGHRVVLEAPAAVHIPGHVPHTGWNIGDVDVLNVDVYAPARPDIAHLADHQGELRPPAPDPNA